MDTALFDYPLPPERIAQFPAEPRDSSRLLVVERATRKATLRIFRDLPQLLPANTRLFRNHASVFKARLLLTRPTGGQIECLLLNPDLVADVTGHIWWCLLKPGRKFPPGVSFGSNGIFTATVIEKNPDGRCLVRFDVEIKGGVLAVTEKLGIAPLPPYIQRNSATTQTIPTQDSNSYQTVYADPTKKIAAAAPTAGLHFTPAVLEELSQRGVSFHDLALRVGLDTFRPITANRVEDHVIHREWYEIPVATRTALAAPGGPRLAVGTTTLRSLEDYFAKKPSQTESFAQPWIAEADIFIYPPRTFAGADMLLTNFHLPRSTLLCLVSAFLTPGSTHGINWIKELYADAVAQGFRFYSYGDAMLIL